MTDETTQNTDPLSRRTVLGGAAALVGTGTACLIATRAAAQTKTAQTKTPQTAAKYQDHPQGQSKCSGCVQFQAPDACKVVEGKISPEGWCQLFAAKSG